MVEKFNYDPEADIEKSAKALRLPFALCKANGIEIQDWWTPKDAWAALQGKGYVNNVSKEYEEYYKKQKAEAAKKRKQELKKRNEVKRMQLRNPEHNADPDYQHVDGQIAGATKGRPMSFEEADSGKCNPFYKDNFNPFTKSGSVIGYATNCQTCVATYIARRQGYDVRALPNLNNKEIAKLSYDTMLAYENPPKPIFPKQRESKADFVARITPNVGDICTLSFSWGQRMAGHIVIAENRGEDHIVYDPQTNKIYKGKEITSFMLTAKRLEAHNMKGVRINEEYCDKIMKGANKNER